MTDISEHKNIVSAPVFNHFDISLPCKWKYWHRAENRLRDKTGFGMYMYNPQNVEKRGFGKSVYVSVRPSVRLARFSRELSRA